MSACFPLCRGITDIPLHCGKGVFVSIGQKITDINGRAFFLITDLISVWVMRIRLHTYSRKLFRHPTHPVARRFIRRALEKKKHQGFTYFKLDFNVLDQDCVFADGKSTRLQAMRKLFSLYRKVIGESGYLLACIGTLSRGCIGYADFSRIGPDSIPYWKHLHTCTLSECIRAIGNSSLSNGIFHVCDPDVTCLPGADSLIFKNKTVSWDEYLTWHSFVGMSGGIVSISEPVEKKEMEQKFDFFAAICPPIRKKEVSFDAATQKNHPRFGYRGRQNQTNFLNLLVWNPDDCAKKISIAAIVKGVFHAKSYNVFSFWENCVYDYLTDTDTLEFSPHA